MGLWTKREGNFSTTCPLGLSLELVKLASRMSQVVVCSYMCVTVCSRFKGSQERKELLVVYVCDERIRSEQQLTG